MRLLNVLTNSVEEFMPSETPEYAILSHRWGKASDEVSYTDMLSGRPEAKPAYAKIQASCQQAIKDQIEFIWIDTLSIDKNSSTELSEAINSMYAWYENSKVCYAYLSDVPENCDLDKDPSTFIESVWFTRGWTLQELLAPKKVIFFSYNWRQIGDKMSLSDHISKAANIKADFLDNSRPLKDASIAQRMSWASRRTTSRPEDIAYCLLGLFSVNMDLRYGEGIRAFRRLQEEIMRDSDDESLFAWIEPTAPKHLEHGLLADSPSQFAESYDIVPQASYDSQPYNMTNKGLRIELPLRVHKLSKLVQYGYLNCISSPATPSLKRKMILLKRGSDHNRDRQYRRVTISLLYEDDDHPSTSTIFVPQSEPRLGQTIRPPDGNIFFIRSCHSDVWNPRIDIYMHCSSINWISDSAPPELVKSRTRNGFMLSTNKNTIAVQVQNRNRTEPYKEYCTAAIGSMHNALFGFDAMNVPLNSSAFDKGLQQPQLPGTWLQTDKDDRLRVTVRAEKVRLRAGGALQEVFVDCFAIDVVFRRYWEKRKLIPTTRVRNYPPSLLKFLLALLKEPEEQKHLKCPSCDELVPEEFLGQG